MNFRLVTGLAAAVAALTFGCSSSTTTSTGGDPTSTPPGDATGDGTPSESPPSTTPPGSKPPSTPPPKAPALTLDTSFGSGGAIADASNTIESMAPGPGGVTYVALRKAGGSIGWGNGTLLRRYTPAGALDATFATQGELETSLVANPAGLAVDATGRVLVGGDGFYDPPNTSDTGNEIVVVRVTSAGAIDTSYGSSGRAVLSFGPANAWTTSVHALSGGGAFVSVYGRTNGNESYGSFLVDASGAPVTAYGTNGFRSSPFPTDGAALVGDGVAVPGTSSLARVGPDGASHGNAIAVGVAMAKTTKDGGFLAVVTEDGTTFELARYSSIGAPDASYVPSKLPDAFLDFDVLPDGSAIVADGTDITWVAPKGGTAEVVVKGAGAGKVIVAGGKLLTMTTTDPPSVKRYTF